MSSTLLTTEVANATLTNHFQTLHTNGMIVNNTNRELIKSLYGERITSKTPPLDVLLPNGFPLLDWSMSIRNLVPKYMESVGIEKAILIAKSIIKMFIPYAVFVQTTKTSNGQISNIVLTFKSTSEMARMAVADATVGMDLTDIDSILDLADEKYWSFKDECYYSSNGTKLLSE